MGDPSKYFNGRNKYPHIVGLRAGRLDDPLTEEELSQLREGCAAFTCDAEQRADLENALEQICETTSVSPKE